MHIDVIDLEKKSFESRDNYLKVHAERNRRRESSGRRRNLLEDVRILDSRISKSKEIEKDRLKALRDHYILLCHA